MYILCVEVAVSLENIGAVGHTLEVGLLAIRELLYGTSKVICNPAEFARTPINNCLKQPYDIEVGLTFI